MPVSTLSTPNTRSRYTYDQFRQAAQNSGLLGEFSDADLSLAQRNPDAGMSLLSYKNDYRNATTDAERELANLGAEGIRRSYGSYTGGSDGGQYYLEPMSPNMFEYPDAPSFTGGSNAGTVSDLYDQMLNYGDFEYGPAPEYNNRWDETITDLIDQILNNPDFSYDPATDPLYQNYRQQYTREGQRATADALGIAAAASGGLPSSYAQTAANQASNYYAAQMTDMIPQLYQLAYDRYLNDYNMMLSDLGVVQGQEENDYNKYLTDLNQYNTDREFDYGAWLDRYNILSNNLQTGQSLDDIEFERYLAQLQQYNTDRDFAYGQFLDEINDQTADFETLVGMSELAAQYGDYRGLQNLGIQIPQISSGSGVGSGAGDSDNADDTDTGSNARPSGGSMTASAFLGQINRIPGLTEENKIAMAADAYNNGQLSEEEYNRVLDSLGY